MKVFAVIFGVTLFIYIIYRVYRFQTLDEGIDTLLKNGAVILDVRTTKEYEMGHIKGSLNISLGTLSEKYPSLDRNKTYITVCSHGLRSVKAEHILKEKGFMKVHNGGAWNDLQKNFALKTD